MNFGYVKSREFMDVVKKKRRSDMRNKMHLHNNEAGRRVSGIGGGMGEG